MVFEPCFVRKSYSTFLTDHWVKHMLDAFVALKMAAVVISLWTLITLENPLFGMNFANMVTFIKLVSKVAERMNNFKENYELRINI